MRRFGEWYGALPLKSKIMAVIMSVCAAALLWTLTAFIALDIIYVHRGIAQEISSQADLVASQSEAALVFGDRKAAEETLAAVGKHSHVRRVILYAADASIFASYLAPGVAAPDKSPPKTLDTVRFSGRALSVAKGVNRRGETLGWVYVESDMREFYERLGWLASVTMLILAVAVPFVFIAARLLQAPIANPLISLVNATRNVTRDKDYSVRAEGAGRDEVGELVEAFNKMLEQVQLRDEKLRVYAEGLENTVAERTALLEEAKARAEAATHLKNKFLSLVSHDLRSPLSSVIWAAQMLLMRGENALEEEKRNRMISNIHTTSLGLVTLINKLLDISRLHTGQIVPIRSVIRLRPLVEESVATLESMAERKEITVVNEIPDSMIVCVDTTLFREVINNLFTNAVKFTPPGGKVTVWSPDGGTRMVSVTNTCAGVPPAIIGDLFRHEIKTTTFGTAGEKGTGLGLPYCHDIMTAHNGSISVESVEGERATFTIALPPITAVILVVDDQEAQRGVIRDILQEVEGLALIEAINGYGALEAMDNVPPALVITDIEMPGMDGFTFIEKLREDGRIAATPVIVVTALAQLGDTSFDNVTKRAAELGVARVIAKPIAGEDLLAAVREFVKDGQAAED